jgi:hypothetical protein
MTTTVVVARRMATEEGAKVMGGHFIPDTAVEIDAGLLERDVYRGRAKKA